VAKQATAQEATKVQDTEHGIELKEVDFKEFERRSVPRMSNYDAFVQYVESVSAKPTLLKI